MQAYTRNDPACTRLAALQALELHPDHPEALNLLGTALLQLGQPGEAVESLERAARAQRGHPGLIGNLAQAYLEAGRHDEALEAYRKASRLDPRAVQYQIGMAISHAVQGRLAEAEILLRRGVSRFPHDALARFNLGNVLRDQQRADEAMDCYRAALEREPGLVDARNNLAGVLQALLRFEDAEREYRHCLTLAPDHLLAQCNLASVLIAQGHFGEGARMCRDLIRAAPDMGHAHALLGNALRHQGRLLEALEHHRIAAKLAPEDTELVALHAIVLTEAGQFGEGLRRLSAVLARDADAGPTHQKLASVLLAGGGLVDGWVEFASRPARVEFRDRHPDVPLTATLPGNLQGKHVLLLREQGLGDEIFFLRYAPQLGARGARITYCAGDKLAGLLERIPCIGQLLTSMDALPAADAVMLAGDLPHALNAFPSSRLPAPPRAPVAAPMRDYPWRIAVFWPPIPPSLTLMPLNEKLHAVRDRLAAAGRPPYLGVTWRGGIPAREHRSASWTLHKELDKETFATALRAVRGTLLSLQRNPQPGEIGILEAATGRTVHDFSDLNDDLEGMLALLALIDEYVGVSNTNMHLRAAAGRTARVLVPCPPEWRWMDAGSTSPWFPSFRVYRQQRNGNWANALAALARDLSGRQGEP